MSKKIYLKIATCGDSTAKIKVNGTCTEIMGLMCNVVKWISMKTGISPVKLAEDMLEVIKDVEESNPEA